MRGSARLSRGLLRRTGVGARRFVPPWETDGKTAEEFFGGLLQSSNPIQKRRREAERQRRADETAIVEDAVPPEAERRLAEMEAHNAKVAQERRNFLPYGATPHKYFDTTDMAAWGAYEAALRSPMAGAAAAATPSPSSPSSSASYSEHVQQQLVRDMDDKIPYRYSAYVEPASSPATRTRPQWPLHGSVGVVMDIDGVVHRGRQLIPGADTAVQHLRLLRIPFAFMTNGGGKSEAEKAEELSALLGCSIDARQVLLAHSPMRLLAPEYAAHRVLVVGSPHCADIAREYGFRRAISIQQYQCEHPEMVPFKKWGDLQRAAPGASVAFPAIGAILQMNDPEDAFNDIQTMLDVLLAPSGQVGRYVSAAQTTPYFAAADDLLWATEAPLPRLGQGAFREMLASVYESVTGEGLQLQQYGKPRAIAYAFAEQRLKEVSASLGWDPNQCRAIFMVGDNIESDIVGANAAGGLWTSVHVLSGIGRAPAARRTLSIGDDELEWIESCVSKTPHYVAPTLDHFVRELLAFPEAAVLQNKTPYHGRPNPVDLRDAYHFSD
ncbi:Haloacid dehalogenase-like hydrolase/HAD-hyrolase-like [Novymonas esmeraldas]|uniref:Haloacid dehalogenase-like hydrolase/HAD-hyrolase-like n=1 Tax=Novymonas esmeraldas TaxID=1808958 RepID=A0AAW0F3W1_9TRYP